MRVPPKTRPVDILKQGSDTIWVHLNTLPDYWVENSCWSVVQAGDDGGSGQREQWGRMDLGNVLKS